MKTLFRRTTLFLAAAVFCGCAARHPGPVYRAGDENPPEFLSSPVAGVLTNLNGFSAHVSATTSSAEREPRTKSGELLGREGRLIFQPTLFIKGKRAREEGGLFFIWDETKHSGYVLSEALQAYAPIEARAGTASPVVNSAAKEGIQEEVNGHPCHRSEAVVPFDSGLNGRLTLWQADDLKHFPVRIEWVRGSDNMTLNFSEVRLEYPAQELFRPPDGFTSYPTAVALMNELIVRDSSLAQKYQTGTFDEPTDVRPSNWHQSNPAVR